MRVKITTTGTGRSLHLYADGDYRGYFQNLIGLKRTETYHHGHWLYEVHLKGYRPAFWLWLAPDEIKEEWL